MGSWKREAINKPVHFHPNMDYDLNLDIKGPTGFIKGTKLYGVVKVTRASIFGDIKRRYIGGHDPQDNKAFFYQVDGPFDWCLIFIRDYLTRVVMAESKECVSEHQAEELVDKIFKEIEQQPELGLQKLLGKDFRLRIFKNLDYGFDKLATDIDNLPFFN